MDTCPIFKARKQILQQWEEKSRERFPAAWAKAHHDLQDHLPQILDSLCNVLDGKAAEDVEVEKLSRIHGRQRFSFGDYTLAQLLGEYKLLKEIVGSFDEQTHLQDLLERSRVIGSFFDDASSVAAAEFAYLREKELKKANADLEKSHGELERFAAVAAHDLRSPLATIVGYCDLLKDESESPTISEYAEVINATSARTIHLIDRLLEYTKIDYIETKKERVDLNQILLAAKENLHEAIEKTQATFIVADLGETIGDPLLIGQLFQNLLANSLKFQKKDTACVIKIHREPVEGNMLRICIEDNGIGFNQNNSAEIFKPFKRAHSSEDYKGSGLGLATCQKVVEVHGGTIEAHSSAGQGATFCFTLPDAKPV